MNETRKRLFGMMIVLSMGIFLALPQGIHLELCFGFDGHVDAAPDTCLADFENQPQQQVAGADEHHHHEKCFDVVIGCVSWDILLRNIEKGDAFGTNAICRDFFSPASCSISEGKPVHFSYTPRSCIDIPAQSLLSRQTVVLLV